VRASDGKAAEVDELVAKAREVGRAAERTLAARY
jgi:hypothetical protein